MDAEDLRAYAATRCGAVPTRKRAAVLAAVEYAFSVLRLRRTADSARRMPDFGIDDYRRADKRCVTLAFAKFAALAEGGGK